MATITTTHTDPDEQAAIDGHNRAVTVMTAKFNEMTDDSVGQIDFSAAVVAFIRGIDTKGIISGASSLGSTTPVAALGGSSSTSTPPTGVVDHHKLGVDFAAALDEAGWADPSVGLAYIRDLINEIRVAKVTGNTENMEKLRKALSKFAHNVQPTDLENDGTQKVFAAFMAMKSERDAATTAKTTAETTLNTVTLARDALQTKLDAIKTKWEAAKVKLNDAFDGDKFKKGAPVPVTELKAVTDAF